MADKANIQSSKPSSTEEPASPCVRNCCLNNEDICLGCWRHLDEILTWQRLTKTEKQAVLHMCESRRQRKC